MLRTTWDLVFELQQQGYRNPNTKIQRLVREGKLFPIRRGLYETDPNVDRYLLAGVTAIRLPRRKRRSAICSTSSLSCIPLRTCRS